MQIEQWQLFAVHFRPEALNLGPGFLLHTLHKAFQQACKQGPAERKCNFRSEHSRICNSAKVDSIAKPCQQDNDGLGIVSGLDNYKLSCVLSGITNAAQSGKAPEKGLSNFL